MDSKTVAQTLLDLELPRSHTLFSRWLDQLHPGWAERPHIIAEMIEREQKPFSVHVGEMVRVDDPLLGFLLSRFSVGQFELLPLRSGFGQQIEYPEVGDRLHARPKRDRLFPIRDLDRNGIWQRRRHFFEGADQRFLEIRSAILLQRLFRDQQRE